MLIPRWCLWALTLSLVERVSAVDYLQDIKPILTEHCVSCHGADHPKSDLRLDTAAGARIGGRHGPALTSGAVESNLLWQVISGTHAELPTMPYKKPALSSAAREQIRLWLAAGAPAPENELPGRKIHWSFVPPARPAVPVRDDTRHPIDAFIRHRLDKEGLTPSPEADGVTLLRRVSLDLTGLPPSPADVDQFTADSRPDAYERAVDRLLASPHYGERWGRVWLDLARYADSNGYSIDAPRSIWPWRDWVIQALNSDQPFDRFVIEQLAGDLLAPADSPDDTHLRQRLATGFHRNTQINEEGGIDPEQFRIEAVLDRVNTTGTALLGLTIGCAQCHDHKFDPVSQREYFQLYAFFNTQDEVTLEAASAADRAARTAVERATQPVQQELDERGQALEPQFAARESTLTPTQRENLPLEVRNVLGLRPEQRSDAQRKVALRGFFQTDPEYRALEQRLQQVRSSAPKIPTSLALQERTEPRTSVVFIKGDFTRPGDPVQPGTPAVLPPLPVTDRSANRLDLAQWLMDPQNPLTARVLVNRVWQQYFGKGLVETENDFGTQGSPPSHPALLDWLACEFMEPTVSAGPAWSLKSLHRLIVTSATYRQSSRVRPETQEKDANNRWLSRQNRLRLDAELVRDVALVASGTFNPRIGGPGVFPPQPDGVMNLGQSRRSWTVSTGGDQYRRGMYTFFWRATPHPALAVFDAPDGFSTCTRRLRSNTPLQALTLLNDAAFVELARHLADRIQREAPEADRLDYAVRLCLARGPSAQERERLRTLWQEESREVGDAAAWMTVARVLLNLDETITRE